jgi:hypothetical protein
MFACLNQPGGLGDMVAVTRASVAVEAASALIVRKKSVVTLVWPEAMLVDCAEQSSEHFLAA